MPTSMSRDDRSLLIQMTQEAFHLPTWNGTNLQSSLRRVSAATAEWLPPGGRRCIAEIVVHCAYWKYALRRQLRGDQRGSFGLPGSNWFRIQRPLSPPAWAEYLELLDDQHRRLCAAIAETPLTLRLSSAASRDVVRKIFGLAIHDAYHTGQVQMIRKLWKRTQGGSAKTTRR